MAVVKGNENWSVATNRGLRSKYGVFSAVTDLLTEAVSGIWCVEHSAVPLAEWRLFKPPRRMFAEVPKGTPVFVRQRGRVCVVCAGARSYLGEIGFSSS